MKGWAAWVALGFGAIFALALIIFRAPWNETSDLGVPYKAERLNIVVPEKVGELNFAVEKNVTLAYLDGFYSDEIDWVEHTCSVRPTHTIGLQDWLASALSQVIDARLWNHLSPVFYLNCDAFQKRQCPPIILDLKTYDWAYAGSRLVHIFRFLVVPESISNQFPQLHWVQEWRFQVIQSPFGNVSRLLSGVGSSLSGSNGILHILGLGFSEPSKPLSLVVQPLSGVPEAIGGDEQEARENRSNERAKGSNPSWPIHPAYLIFGFSILGATIVGLGFDFWEFQGRRIAGGAFAVLGIAVLAYALFWPLAFGGYGWPW